jgi:hypothetical protein
MKKGLVVAAVVAFGLAAFGIAPVSWVSFLPLGLALWAVSELVGGAAK